MYGLVVYDCKVSPGYFLDEMQLSEVEFLMKRRTEAYQDGWEKTRFLAYVTACSMGAKLKEPKDLLPFAWDKKAKREEPKHTPSEIEKMRAEMINSMENYESGKVTQLKV